MFLAVTDDQQAQAAQQSESGFFPNAQNILITGGTFIVSLVVFTMAMILVLIHWTEQY